MLRGSNRELTISVMERTLTLVDKAIAAIIEEKISGKSAEIYAKLIKDSDPLKDARYRADAEKQINEMSNIELIELISKVL